VKAVEWFRWAMPEDWGTARLKDHAKVINGYPFDSKLFATDAGHPLVRIRDISSLETVVRYDGDWVPEAAIANGDVLVGMDGDFNVARWQGSDALLNQRVCCVRAAQSVDPGYLYYTLDAPLRLINEFTYSTTVKHLSSFDVLDIRLSYPQLEQQRLIANYLDRETARIDGLIAEKERMLALLEEKRSALISRLVTRGLNPNAPFKPSGQEWLGEIPGHWEVQPIKYLAVVGNGSTPSVENAEYWDQEGFPWLNSSVVNLSPVTSASRYVTETALRECHLPIIQPPAVLVGITGQGKTRGMVALLGMEATINQHLAFIKPRSQKIGTEYLYYLLGHAYAFLRSDSDGAGSTKGAITCEQLANLKIPVPPIKEQIEICTRIGQTLDVSTPLRSEITSSLDLLAERRSSLITAAVTGQIPLERMNK
jgi:type I restriction enzyme S subunit